MVKRDNDMSSGWGDGAEVEVDMSTWSRRSGDGQGSGSVSAPSSSVEGSRSDYDAHGVPRSPGSLPAADASPSPVRVHDVVIRRVGEIRNDVLDRFRAIMRLERRKKRARTERKMMLAARRLFLTRLRSTTFRSSLGRHRRGYAPCSGTW